MNHYSPLRLGPWDVKPTQKKFDIRSGHSLRPDNVTFHDRDHKLCPIAHASKLNCEKLCCGGEHPGVEESAPDAKTYDGGAPVPDHG